MSHITREKAIELVSCNGAMVLRVDENVYGIGILAYSYTDEAAVRYYFSKLDEYIDEQILSHVAVNVPTKMRVFGNNHLVADL